MKNKLQGLPSVHHIHVRYGDNVYTLCHNGSCIDLLDLLQQITSIQIFEENNAKTGVRK